MSTSGLGSHEARFYETKGKKVQCLLCPHECLISEGKRGICGVRENRSGKLYALTYGLASSIHPDPIEKKPLFHFMPGTMSLSLGSVGCNLKCRHCQNYSISRASPEDGGLISVSTGEIVQRARESGAESVSWTYNEPTIWHEFTTDASRAIHESGLKTNYVTNGYISDEPLRDLKGVIDAMNIDVKAFRDEFYRQVCGGHLAPVLKSCEAARELGIHIELTYLVIPGYNDSESEVHEFSKWVADSLSRDTPVHFSAFHPDYRLTEVERTPFPTLNRAYESAVEAGLEHVYIGNVRAGERENTHCPGCGALLIQRDGFRLAKTDMSEGRCAKCGRAVNIVL
ncbi:MAG: AmmeMemoRadiSam system radical SAM enzyme [Methanobacteriota archaeon]|nr:MAG: AmmeMemoRadiSam system radical SAM enzyme [Euryarchaeota archaeon]